MFELGLLHLLRLCPEFFGSENERATRIFTRLQTLDICQAWKETKFTIKPNEARWFWASDYSSYDITICNLVNKENRRRYHLNSRHYGRIDYIEIGEYSILEHIHKGHIFPHENQ
jgi:hypothetical protein